MSPDAPRAPQHRGPRLFVEGLSASSSTETFTLNSETSHYVRDVLRLRVGESLELGDKNTGDIFTATVTLIDEAVHLRLGGRVHAGSVDTLGPTLLFALCKGDKNDLTCDWATELGCSRIVFWQADRSVVRLRDARDVTAKQGRLSKIAQSAAQQSKQNRPPDVTVSASLAEALRALSSQQETLRLACSLDPLARPLVETLKGNSLPVTLVVGPEGDLSPDESTLLQRHGFLPVSLGGKVLRSELAAVSALIACRISSSLFE